MALENRWIYRLVSTKTSRTCQHHSQSRPPTRRPLLPLEGSPVPREVVLCVNGFVNYLNSSRRSLKRSSVVTPNVSYGQFFRAQDGMSYDMFISLVQYAQIYHFCFPFNTETIHKGWYDEYIHSSEGTGFLCIYTNNSPILMTSPL